MAVDYTTSALVTSIQLKGHIPTNQTPFTAPNLLSLADDELETSLASQIVSVRENYYATYVDYDSVADGIYDIPSRSVGGGMIKVWLVTSTVITPCVRSEISDQMTTNASSQGVYSFYIYGNKIKIQPSPTNCTVRVWYNLRPSKLVPVTSAAQIVSIAGNVITVSAVPTGINSSTPIDIIQDQPLFSMLLQDSTPTATTATTITVSSVPDSVAVGDWVTVSNQSPIPQIPVEFRPLLVQRVVVKYYEIQGYMDKMKAAQVKLEEMQKALFDLINPRVSEEPKRIIANYGLIGGYSRWRSYRVGP